MTSGINVTNVLRADFCTKVSFHSFHMLAVWLCYFWLKNIGAKAIHKILVKLMIDINLANISRAASCTKVFFHSFCVLTTLVCNFSQKEISKKAACKMFVKLSTGSKFQARSR